MFEKIMWSFFVVANLIDAFFWATKGDNIWFELINLFGLYVSLKELMNEVN